MPFTDEEAQSLLAVKGIGKPYCSVCSKWGWMMLPKLAIADLDNILEQGRKN